MSVRDAAVTVEWPTRADGHAYLEVHSLAEAVMRLGGAVGFRGVPSRVDIEDWLDGVLERVAQGVAELATVRVGADLVALGRWERYEGPLVAVNADIRQVMVHPRARGRGIATVLVSALIDRAREQRVETLTLDVRGNNHVARALYEGLGFEVCGLLPDFVAVGRERFDRVNYRLDLRGPDADVVRHGSRPEGAGAAPIDRPS